MDRGPIGSASAFLTTDPVGTAKKGEAVAAWLGQTISGFFSDNEDLSGYTGSDALHSAIEEKALSLKQTQEQILSGLENTAEFADNAAIPIGMEAVVTAFDAEDNQDTAQADMGEAIDEYYAGVQDDVLSAFDSAVNQIIYWYEQTAAHSDLSHTDVFETFSGRANFDDTTVKWRDGNIFAKSIVDDYQDSDFSEVRYSDEFTLENGSTKDITVYIATGTNTSIYEYIGSWYPTDSPNSDYDTAIDKTNTFAVKSAQDGERLEIFEDTRYHAVWSDITDSRDRVYNELSGFVDDLYDAYEPGEIDTAEIVDPLTAHTEFRNEIDDGSFRGAHAAGSLGIPRSTGSEPMIIELHDDGITVEGSIYGEIADGLETDLKYYTNIDQLDSEDTEENSDGDTVPIDETATPVLDEGPLWIRGTYTEEDSDGNETETSDYTDLDQPFTILDAVDQDGNDVSQVEFESGPEYDPSDIDSIQEQLEQVREFQIEQQQEAAEDINSGGSLFGGGFTDSAEGFLSDDLYGIPVIGWLVAVTGVGLYFNGD